MEHDELSEFLVSKRPKILKSYSNVTNSVIEKQVTTKAKTSNHVKDRIPLTTKAALELLLDGTLKYKVCRYCLNITSPLHELDQVFHVGAEGILYKVTIRDMIACFHPYKVIEDPNFPSRICDKCLNTTISSYMFTQQCEQASRALRNYFDDMYEKLDKLDPLERTKKRGRQKLNPNYNTLYAEYDKVIKYADPTINIINTGSQTLEKSSKEITDLECPRCWEILPNIESLFNHEKVHPKTMWFSCRLCGKSYPKRHLYKKHIKTGHEVDQQLAIIDNGFRCNDCGMNSESYDQHLQHMEKHKFKMVLEHLIERKMDNLCVVCLGKGDRLEKLDKTINMYGGCPELTGQRSLYNILGSTMPEMHILNSYTGTKICEKCLNYAITSYIFLNQAHYIRNRLNTCVNLMLDSLNKVVNTEGNIFIEIAQNVILPDKEPDLDESLFVDENEDFDETKLNVDVLEDEFRVISETESEKSEFGAAAISEVTHNKTNNELTSPPLEFSMDDVISENPAKNVKRTYVKRKLYNGIQSRYSSDSKYNAINNVCSEFLTFKKKKKPIRRFYTCKFTCPLCHKHFISDYFLRRHVLKHVIRRVECKFCTRQFKSKFYLYEHTKTVHLLGKSSYFSCKTCGRTFISHSKLLVHTKTHKTKECQLCDKIFVYQKHYDSHMQRHTVKLKSLKEKYEQTCSFCEKACSNDNDLSVHVNKVHLQIKPYSCDMCEKQFYTEANLNSHKLVHNMYSKETCTFCSKTLKTRKELVIHVRKHIDVKPYSCQICAQAFYSQTKLNNHMRIFHGGKLCCKLCKTVCVNKSGLKDHINRAHNII